MMEAIVNKFREKENSSNNYAELLERTWSDMDGSIPRKVTAVVVGAGQRGKKYADYALDFPFRLQIVGVADPRKNRREKMISLHDIPTENVFDTWEKLAAKKKLADCAIIATQDRMHKDPAIALAEKGYHLLLEKPMSSSEEECEAMAEVFLRSGVIVAICHVLRYLPVVAKIRQVIDSGRLGEVVTINHTENILFWHFAHSFVRGNWRNENESTFSLLAKSCHDIDLVMYWMGDRKCKKIQSFGSLKHFKASEKPSNAADRCLECKVEDKCPYSAQKVYLNRCTGVPRWPMSVVCDIEDDPRGYPAALRDAIASGPYGRCVYSCDNDVCDHQMVNMEFVDGATASVTMNAFTRHMCRETRICGTRGELRWDGTSLIVVNDFATGVEEKVPMDLASPPPNVRTGGHGGGDFFLMNAFVKAVASNQCNKEGYIKTGVVDSLRSHKLVFAAERARIKNTIEAVDI